MTTLCLSDRERAAPPLIDEARALGPCVVSSLASAANHFDAAVCAIIVDGALLARAADRAAVRALLRAARRQACRVALCLDTDPVLWPTLALPGSAQLSGRAHAEDPMVTAHLQSFLHLCDVVTGSEDDVLVAGGSADLDDALRLARAKTNATFVIELDEGRYRILEHGRLHDVQATRATIRAGVARALLLGQSTLECIASPASQSRIVPRGPWSGALPLSSQHERERARSRAPAHVLVPAPRLRRLPSRGTLLVSTDLHGNLDDLRALRRRFEALCAERTESEVHWVALGDNVHGPDPGARQRLPAWCDYDDASAAIIDELHHVESTHRGRVHLLLGAHEHGHLGGPHPRRFWPDEVERLDDLLDDEGRGRLYTLFARAPLLASSPSGLVLCHAVPDVILSAADLEAISLDPTRNDPQRAQVLTSLLRTTGPRPAGEVRRWLAGLGDGPSLLIHGHDEHAAGFARGDGWMCPVIFGAAHADKRCLVLDLARRYDSSETLIDGREIVRLHEPV